MTGQELVDDLILAWYQTQHTKGRMILVSPEAWFHLQNLVAAREAYENDLHFKNGEPTFRGLPVFKVNASLPKGFKIVTEVEYRDTGTNQSSKA